MRAQGEHATLPVYLRLSFRLTLTHPPLVICPALSLSFKQQMAAGGWSDHASPQQTYQAHRKHILWSFTLSLQPQLKLRFIPCCDSVHVTTQSSVFVLSGIKAFIQLCICELRATSSDAASSQPSGSSHITTANSVLILTNDLSCASEKHPSVSVFLLTSYLSSRGENAQRLDKL